MPKSNWALLLLLTPVGWAQTLTHANGWYMYFGDHAVSRHWGVHLEGQWRRSNVVTGRQQSMLRPAVNYKINDHLQLSAGYGHVRSYPFGERPSEPSREHRVYQEASVSHGLRRVDVEHRFRMEQRFESEMEQTDWQYSNRGRYRLQVRIPLGADSTKSARVYLSFYDEVFLNWGAHSTRTFDQNRAYGALGFNIGRETRIEGGYLHQFVARQGRLRESNHTLQFAIFSELPFRE